VCGIVGFIKIDLKSSESLSQNTASRMVGAMWHRGPDAEGQWRSNDNVAWLGHRRLAIVDLTTGDQPMTNEDGRLWVTFNGEIYNYKALRAELEVSGHHFKTSSDTEVLVHGFEQWGGEGLSRKLRGIFAFAIYDTKSRQLFLARDHMGVKPLHWWTDGEVFLFASEIKSLLLHPRLVNRRVYKPGVAQFLVTRYVSRPNTILEGIQKLPEGSYLEVQAGRREQLTPRVFWDVRYAHDEISLSFNDAIEELDKVLKETVRMQLMSDVPLGAQLSGGVDSSVVVALMEVIRRESGDRNLVKTFAVGFDVEKFNEFPYARQIASRYGTDHQEIHVGFQDFVDSLAHLCWVYDEPMGEAPGIPTYLMCKKAKESVSVMLCGEGADEQFGGYRKYAFEHLSRFVDWVPAFPRKKLMRGVGAFMPFWARRMRSIMEILALNEKSARFASWYGALDTALQSTLLSSELSEHVSDLFIKEVFDKLITTCDCRDPLDQFLYCDIHSRLVDTLLVKADRMSMGASIEARVPFLDTHVVEFAAALPPEYKVAGLKTKRLLKKLAERYAPSEVVYRRKVGFTMPLSEWFVGPLSNLVRTVLLSEQCLSRGYYRADVLRKIVDGHLSRKTDREQGIWVLLALELWHRLYIDDDGTEAAVNRLKENLLLMLAVGTA
jgi:asparagine synthase (glutamine-hydrolysing)